MILFLRNDGDVDIDGAMRKRMLYDCYMYPGYRFYKIPVIKYDGMPCLLCVSVFSSGHSFGTARKIFAKNVNKSLLNYVYISGNTSGR
jgi:hypothetical protein